MVLLLGLAWNADVAGVYHDALIAGLVLSLVGDVFLMLPKDRFIAGLVSFLFAHIAYSVGFWSQLDGGMIWWLPAMLAAAGVIVFLLLLPSLGKMLLPVAVYIAVIVQMAWAAGEYWLTSGSTAAALAFGGALIFMFSDLCLAIERFRGPFKPSAVVVMGSYFMAQSLFVASLLV